MSESTDTTGVEARQVETTDDVQEQITNWAKFSTILFAIAGVGVGLLYILGDAFDEAMLEVDNGIGAGGAAGAFGELIFLQFAVVAVILSVFVGFWLARSLVPNDDATIFKVSAATIGIGVFVFFLVAVVLTSMSFDGVSLQFGGVLVNGIATGVVAALVGVGGAWTALNQSPN